MRGRRDLGSGAVLAGLAAAYLIANRRYPLDALAAPGPGVFPLAVGLLMLALAALQALAAMRAPAPRPTPPETDARRRGLRLPAMVALVVACAGAAGAVGFLPASFALVLLSSRLLGAPGWLRPTALALGATAAVHLLFQVWLGVPLPASPLG